MRVKSLAVVGLFALITAWVNIPVEAQAQSKSPTMAEVKTSKLNVRSSGNPDAPVIAQLVQGDLVPAKKLKEGWVRLAWSTKAYVSADLVSLPEGRLNKRPKYEDLREMFIDRARGEDPTIQWLEVPRASSITVRFHWREYRNKEALIKRAEALARMYSTMTLGEKGIEVVIVNGNEQWAKAFY